MAYLDDAIETLIDGDTLTQSYISKDSLGFMLSIRVFKSTNDTKIPLFGWVGAAVLVSVHASLSFNWLCSLFEFGRFLGKIITILK